MTNIRTTILIHNGDKTHSHDQSIYPVNFKPINKTVSNPKKPIPPDEDDDSLIVIV